MTEVSPPKRTDGSLYVFRISYHLTSHATLTEEYAAADLQEAIRYAQGDSATTDSVQLRTGNTRIDVIPRSNILYASAEHVREYASTHSRAEDATWKLVRPTSSPEVEEQYSLPAEGEVLSSVNLENRPGYEQGYEQAIDDLMQRCDILLKDTAMLGVLRRYATALRQANGSQSDA